MKAALPQGAPAARDPRIRTNAGPEGIPPWVQPGKRRVISGLKFQEGPHPVFQGIFADGVMPTFQKRVLGIPVTGPGLHVVVEEKRLGAARFKARGTQPKGGLQTRREGPDGSLGAKIVAGTGIGGEQGLGYVLGQCTPTLEVPSSQK